MQLYNTKTKKKNEFLPIQAHKVGLYVCGVTVYDDCHLGHGRTFSFFDSFVRYLRFCQYEVTYVRNVTDVDDKIINRANQKEQQWHDVATYYMKRMNQDFAQLDILSPSVAPKATDSIEGMIQLIASLYKKGFAYKQADGVYFDVSRFEQYGRLSGQTITQLQAGYRVTKDDKKKNPHDFALWKFAHSDPNWDSPWGKGRPGWHIECSAMSFKHLGANFDIHGGGSDLVFPHHENEIAQSTCAHDSDYANYWMHTGMLMVEGEKMSKSLGNFMTIKQALQQYRPVLLRYFFLSAHYRHMLDFSAQTLQQAKQALDTLYHAAKKGTEMPVILNHAECIKTRWGRDFNNALQDDFNTPLAFTVLFELASHINTLSNQEAINASVSLLFSLARSIGVMLIDSGAYWQQQNNKTITVDEKWIQARIDERNRARQDKDWAKADSVRQQLYEVGVILEDARDGTIWRFES